MRISTLLNSGVMRSVAVAAICSMGFAASAQTFIADGVIYKVNKGVLEVQPTKYTSGKNKGKPVECENGETPEAYTGDIVIPATVTYNGTTYPVSSITNGFSGSLITSITLPDGAGVKIGRAGLQNCAELTSVKLNNDLSKIEGNTFQGCVKLTSITIPGSVESVGSLAFSECTGLTAITVEQGETALSFYRDAFGQAPTIETLVINRQLLGDKTQDDRAFRGVKTLKSLTIGGNYTSIAPNSYENCTALETIVFNSDVTTAEYNAFANTGIAEITLPASLTELSSSLFMGCKQLKKVTLGDAVTTIGAMAFYNSTLEEINLPATLKTIGNMAFSGAQLSGDITIPEGVTSIGDQAYANNAGIVTVSIPASVRNIGTGAFMGCAALAKFEVAAENENYAAAADGSYITDKEGKTVLAYAPAAIATEFKGDFTAVAPYAFYGAKNLTAIELPACTVWGDYSLRGTGIKALTIGGTVGRYVAADCPALAEITINCSEIPTGIAFNCAELTKANLPEIVTIVRQDAFAGCAKLESLSLGKVLVILESDCFANSGIKALTVQAFYPASTGAGVFTEASDITVTVPADVVDAYKKAEGWSYLTIVGDANLATGGETLGMPAGLYYAGDDNQLHCVYSDNQSDVYEINMEHTFQLLQFSNRIYGASAGHKFWYSASSATEGDGKLFYISQVDGNLFQAVLIDNAGNNAYMDPTGLYSYGETLYVNDRNVCIRKISANAIALPQDYPSWMENNWMSFYGTIWTYGCIKNGFAITQDQDAQGNPEPRYWVGMKYNGEGLFSFKEGNIGTSSSDVGSSVGANAYLTGLGLIATSFNIDEKNGDLYMYIETAGPNEATQIKGGLYRIKLEDLEMTPTPSAADFFTVLGAELIDGSPVLYEGNATNEHIGISQLAIDENGEYMYWCYRSPETQEEADRTETQDYATQCKGRYYWAEKFDPENPLHHSGIKRIKLGEENPVVEMVVPGVTGYGIVPVNYAGSTKPLGVAAPSVDNTIAAITVAAGYITACEDATLYIYNAAGSLINITGLAAGQSMSTADLAAGIYVIEARTAAGSQYVKIAK